jgi:hypothetical protein
MMGIWEQGERLLEVEALGGRGELIIYQGDDFGEAPEGEQNCEQHLG